MCNIPLDLLAILIDIIEIFQLIFFISYLFSSCVGVWLKTEIFFHVFRQFFPVWTVISREHIDNFSVWKNPKTMISSTCVKVNLWLDLDRFRRLNLTGHSRWVYEQHTAIQPDVWRTLNANSLAGNDYKFDSLVQLSERNPRENSKSVGISTIVLDNPMDRLNHIRIDHYSFLLVCRYA